MAPFRSLLRVISLFTLVSLSIAPARIPAVSALPIAEIPSSGDSGPRYRATVTLRHATDRARLDQLGVVVLRADDMQAVVVVNTEQLTQLARLGLQPTAADTIDSLI